MTKNNPLVSIIVPIYNTAKYLPSCLDSIINQTYQNLEIILIDDGSTDNSYQIAQKYSQKDPRIKLFHQKNAGQSAARNYGIKIAIGRYISFIDSDDKVAQSFIENLLRPYQDIKAILTVCGIHYKRLKQNSISDVYINPLRPQHKFETQKAYILYLLAVDGRMYSSVNKLYRADIVKKISFAVNLNFAEDTKFVLDYLNQIKGKIHFVLEPLYLYNFGTETSTMRSVSTNWNNWQRSYNNLKSWLGHHPKIIEKFWLRMIYFRWRVSHQKQIFRNFKTHHTTH